MAFERLEFTKLWTVTPDKPYFPTVETDESQVRADMQQLFDEIKNYINSTLVSGVEGGNAASSIGAKNGTVTTTVQAILTLLLAASHEHDNMALLDSYTHTEAEIDSAVEDKHTHANKAALDSIASVTQVLGSSTSKVPSEKAVNDALVDISQGAVPDESISALKLQTGSTGAAGRVLTWDETAEGGLAWKDAPDSGLVLADGAIKQDGVDRTREVWEAMDTYRGVFVAGLYAPADTRLLWIDTNGATGGLKYHNGTAWVHVPVAFT